jgi:H+/Cl- antiporter ClcA
VTLLRIIDVVFAFLFGVILFRELPGFYTIVGSLLIVCMTTAMSLYRWHRQELRTRAIRRRKSKERLVQQQQQRLQQQQQQQE